MLSQVGGYLEPLTACRAWAVFLCHKLVISWCSSDEQLTFVDWIMSRTFFVDWIAGELGLAVHDVFHLLFIRMLVDHMALDVAE